MATRTDDAVPVVMPNTASETPPPTPPVPVQTPVERQLANLDRNLWVLVNVAAVIGGGTLIMLTQSQSAAVSAARWILTVLHNGIYLPIARFVVRPSKLGEVMGPPPENSTSSAADDDDDDDKPRFGPNFRRLPLWALLASGAFLDRAVHAAISGGSSRTSLEEPPSLPWRHRPIAGMVPPAAFVAGADASWRTRPAIRGGLPFLRRDATSK